MNAPIPTIEPITTPVREPNPRLMELLVHTKRPLTEAEWAEIVALSSECDE